MHMNQWIQAQIAAPKKRSMPVLSFPCTQLLGITVSQLINSSELQAAGMKAVADRCPTAAAVSLMDLSVEAEAFGAEIRVSDDEVPTVVGALLAEPEDADRLVVPPVGAGRTGLYIEALRQSLELIKDRPVLAGVIGPYSLAGRLMGMTEIMINCYEEPEMVHTTLEKTTAFIIAYCKRYKAIGAQGVVVAEPAAGLLSPTLMAEVSGQYMRQIVEAVQDDSFSVIYHNCGNSANQMARQLADIGAVGYHFGDAVSMKEMVEKLPSDVLVMGNISPAKTFRAGTPEQVRAETLAVMEQCCAHPNFIISSGCDIPPATPWENIDAFFAAVAEFYGP